jgi:hypothetical protein
MRTGEGAAGIAGEEGVDAFGQPESLERVEGCDCMGEATAGTAGDEGAFAHPESGGRVAGCCVGEAAAETAGTEGAGTGAGALVQPESLNRALWGSSLAGMFANDRTGVDDSVWGVDIRAEDGPDASAMGMSVSTGGRTSRALPLSLKETVTGGGSSGSGITEGDDTVARIGSRFNSG